ncbi:DUF926-domain-containing protein [Rickenella mellea]|uniref:DUF926-domain-containing protein n=1 Tax=Rickenella mellea TaxID=50990 RepID=A0A4R5XDP0_9AGAM|nr:DUF926-domain-containing protein [Rickenella mellea]
MATVHPSRMGLVPIDPVKDRRPYDDRDVRDRGQTSTERSRRDPERDRRHDPHRSRSRERNRPADDRGYDRRRSRSPRASDRRRSPVYDEYKRPATPPPRGEDSAAAPPWRVQENMYPPRGRPAENAPNWSGSGAGADFFESRRQQRMNSTFSIYPPSPKYRPRDSPPPDSKSKKKKSKHRRRDPSDSSSSEDDSRERRRSSRKHREKDRKERKKHRHRSDDKSDDDEDRRHRKDRKRSRPSSVANGSDDDGRSHRKTNEKGKRRGDDSEDERSRERSRSGKLSRARSPPRSEEEEEWVEKPTKSGGLVFDAPSVVKKDAGPSNVSRPTEQAGDSDDDDVGPQPASKATTTSKKVDEREYGGALLRGEGSAMAAFLQEGGTDARIPRRGEIGLESDEIAQYEAVGYVMSGSRHRRMNEVRMRKENQVISAEEKRGILKLQREERERREAILRDEFSELVQEKLKGAGRMGGH